ncbi:MAG: single-stranded DNA-binding protein [Caldisericia bacterium]
MGTKLAELNRVLLVGRLTRDPEVKDLENGQKVANISLAANRSYKKTGETDYTKEVTYVRCTAWGKTAELVEKYLHKGDAVLVEGSLVSNQWEKDGQKRTSLDLRIKTLQFLSTKDDKNPEETPGEEVPSDESVGGETTSSRKKKKDEVPF